MSGLFHCEHGQSGERSTKEHRENNSRWSTEIRDSNFAVNYCLQTILRRWPSQLNSSSAQ